MGMESDIAKIIVRAIKTASGEKNVLLEFPQSSDHGDYSTNVALVSAKKTKRNPTEVAGVIVKKLQEGKGLAKYVSRIEVAGPGFINFWLSEKQLTEELRSVISAGEKYGSSTLGKGKTVLVEYSSPNIAKSFGVGHLRSTIIGQALYNTFSFLGYKTIGENHLGDWGTQFGMIIAQVKRKGLDINKLSLLDLERVYVEFNSEMESNPDLREEAKKWFKKLEEGDAEAKKIWQKAKEVSLAEFDRIYKLLDVEVDNAHGESFYEDKMQKVIEEAKKKGLTQKSHGALIMEINGKPPLILLKSDGATTYHTRDLAAIKYRLGTWDPDIFVYEVGADQKLHFEQVFAAAEKLGWVENQEFVHLAHGLIRFEHGKMSTRKGKTVKLEEVLLEAVERSKKIIEKSTTGRGLSDKESKRVSEMVGIGAVKYFDLSHHPTSDIVFDWEGIFVLEGNSGPYLQYTYARAQSVLKKVKNDKSKENRDLKLGTEEMEVSRYLSRFPEIVVNVSKSYSPNLLCNFLFELAQKYNAFYNKNRIIGTPEEKERLLLTAAVGQVIKNGLKLLGIQAPERM